MMRWHRCRAFVAFGLAWASASGTLAEPAPAALEPAGLALFNQQCVACHQAAGKGLPGLAPALAGTLAPLLGSDEGRRYLGLVLVHGLSGSIVSQGQVFVGAMPTQATLSDAQFADVANHLARDLNGAGAPVFTAGDFSAARLLKPSPKELRALRARLLR